MKGYSHVAIGVFLLVALMEAFQGLGSGISYPWYEYVTHLVAVPLLYAAVTWFILRGLGALLRRR
ncbi:MAG: hypothetical protein EPN72_14275 [Nevskiaceae bacterium]|nr:MAG: hypothetical protein EPN63_02140 [Nevskiaceae bacterium]TBR71364.1 MAG: hypothetical protein EPN72_14275 [Nevskiaceae bacterium]